MTSNYIISAAAQITTQLENYTSNIDNAVLHLRQNPQTVLEIRALPEETKENFIANITMLIEENQVDQISLTSENSDFQSNYNALSYYVSNARIEPNVAVEYINNAHNLLNQATGSTLTHALKILTTHKILQASIELNTYKELFADQEADVFKTNALFNTMHRVIQDQNFVEQINNIAQHILGFEEADEEENDVNMLEDNLAALTQQIAELESQLTFVMGVIINNRTIFDMYNMDMEMEMEETLSDAILAKPSLFDF